MRPRIDVAWNVPQLRCYNQVGRPHPFSEAELLDLNRRIVERLRRMNRLPCALLCRSEQSELKTLPDG
jgi:hypothetical protein